MNFSTKQKDILKAILEYINKLGLSKTFNTLLEESSILQSEISSKNTLESKWNTILLLQNKNKELENQLKNLKEDIDKSKVNGTSYNKTKETTTLMGLPKQPEKKSITAHRQRVTSIKFHPVFNLLVSASEDAYITVWEVSDNNINKEQSLRAHTNIINSICFDTNGKLLASCSSDQSIKIWKFDNPLKCLKTLTGHEHSVSSIQFSLDSNTLFSASRDKSVKVWEVNSGFCKNTLKGHSDWVRSISLNSKGSLLASCSDDETVIIWGTDMFQEKYTFSGQSNVIEQVMFVTIQNAVNNIYTSDYASEDSNKEINDDSLINNNNNSKLFEIQKKLAEQSKLKEKSIDKEYIFACSRDKTIKLYDVLAGICLYTFTGHDDWIKDMIIHPTGKYLISTGDDRSIRVWDLKSGRCIRKLEKAHEKFINCLAVDERSYMLVSGSNDLSIKFFDCR